MTYPAVLCRGSVSRSMQCWPSRRRHSPKTTTTSSVKQDSSFTTRKVALAVGATRGVFLNILMIMVSNSVLKQPRNMPIWPPNFFKTLQEMVYLPKSMALESHVFGILPLTLLAHTTLTEQQKRSFIPMTVKSIGTGNQGGHHAQGRSQTLPCLRVSALVLSVD